jgi:hypothetical protein
MREGWIHVGWLEKQQCETCKDMIFVREVIPASATAAEWTPEYVQSLWADTWATEPCKRWSAIADAHKATLDAERVQCMEFRQGQEDRHKRELTAEREKVRILTEQIQRDFQRRLE